MSVDVAATEEAQATNGKTRKTRTKAIDYLEEQGVKILTSAPSVPDEFNPDRRYRTLKSEHFEDELDYQRFQVNLHSFLADAAAKTIEKLEKVPREHRAAMAATIKSTNEVLDQILRFQDAGVDIEDLMAAMQAKLS